MSEVGVNSKCQLSSLQILPIEVQAKIARALFLSNCTFNNNNHSRSFGQDLGPSTMLAGTCRQQTEILLEVAQWAHGKVLKSVPCPPSDCLHAVAALFDCAVETGDASERLSIWRERKRESRMLT
jgi:hypothetical protein